MRRRVLIGLVLAVSVAGLLGWALSGDPQRRASSPGSHALAAASARPLNNAAIAKRFLDRSTLKERAQFVTPDGFPFTVSEGRTRDGAKICAVTEGEGFGASSCATNLSATPVIWGESSSAGPGGANVTDWEVSGLAGPQVERMVVVDSTGRARPVRLVHGAFFFALSHGELKRGITPTTLEAYGAGGALIDSAGL